MGMACSTHGTDENYVGILIRKMEEREPLGKPRCG